MSLLTIKILFALIIFAMGFSCGLLPIGFAKNRLRWLSMGDAFASGVFLSAALIHMLPDATQSFQTIAGNGAYPYAQLICVVVFILLLLMERGILAFCQTRAANQTTPYLLALILSVHSIIAGAALGVNSQLAGALIIFLAIIAHKGSAGFALTTNLHRYQLPTKKIVKIVLLFSLATPLGIIVATTATNLLHTNSGQLFEAIFNSCAAGTFLYLGTVHTMFEAKSLQRWPDASALIFGAAIMAIVAIWL